VDVVGEEARRDRILAILASTSTRRDLRKEPAPQKFMKEID